MDSSGDDYYYEYYGNCYYADEERQSLLAILGECSLMLLFILIIGLGEAYKRKDYIILSALCAALILLVAHSFGAFS